MIGEIDWADARRVRAFLRLGSERLRHPWEVVSDGAVNVLLTELDCPPTIPGGLDEPVVHLRIWRQDGPTPPGVLGSPLQFDDFISALAAAEPSLFPQPAGPAAATGLAGDPATESAQAELAGLVFRLRRWPPAALLAQSRYGIRLASFMSARPISLDELVVLSNVERAECARVIRSLLAQSMLRVQRSLNEPAMVPTQAAASSAAAPVTVHAPYTAPLRPQGAPERLGLLGALRRRLGLALGR